MTSALVRRILLGASKDGLDIAGMALLGPAWPILRGALTPVLELLTTKLGGDDPIGSPAAAERAADAFEEDPRLGELLRTNLGEALRPVLAGQEHLDAGLQVLCQLVQDGREQLDEITRSVGSIDDRLSAGVTLSGETKEWMTDAIRQQLDVALAVQTLAGGAPQPDVAGAPREPWQTRQELIDEANRAETRAVRQVSDGRPAEALETLRALRVTLAPALAETPSDIPLRLQYAYLLKATAQANAASGDQPAADRCFDRAEELFRLVLKDLPADADTRRDIAAAVNGLGNVLAARGRDAGAVRMYREALRLEPTYAYAWHDLFLSLVNLADQGDLRADELDEAWRRLNATAPGYPNLDPSYLARLDAEYQRLRPDAPSARPAVP